MKILLNRAVAMGDLTAKQRNVMLEEMTDDVSALVLKNKPTYIFLTHPINRARRPNCSRCSTTAVTISPGGASRSSVTRA